MSKVTTSSATFFVMSTRGFGAVPQQPIESDVFRIGKMTNRIQPPDLEQLIDEMVEPLQLVFHRLIKVRSLFGIQLPQLQRLQVKTKRGNRRFSVRA